MNHNPGTIRKAAILVASADARTADLLLAQMDEEEAAAVRRAAAMLDQVADEERQAIVNEFCQLTGARTTVATPSLSSPSQVVYQHLQHDARLGGIDLCSPLVQSLLTASSDGAAGSSGNFDPEADASIAGQWLKAADSDTLADFLMCEQPQTIAVVLARLTPHQAAEVLRRLPSALQAEIVERMATMHETDPQVMREVEQGVEAWLAQQNRQARRQAPGISAAARLLEASSFELRQTLLANLASRDAELARRLAVSPLQPVLRKLIAGPTFADLLQADDTTLATVLAAADRNVATLALAGAEHNIVERLRRSMPISQWQMLRSSVENLGAARLGDVEEAQQQLVALALELEAEQRIDLSAIRPVDVTA